MSKLNEAKIRDYIVANFSPFEEYITNISEINITLNKEESEILNSLEPAKISDLIKLTIIDKLRLAISIVQNLRLVDKEFNVLENESGIGRKPSIDILAYNTENYCLAILELKISASAERQAVTELSAYNQGFQNRYRGLSNLEVLWIPISSEWRTTPKSAIEFQLLWKNTLVLPLKMDIVSEQDEIESINLNCFNPVHELKEVECLNIFSYECFDNFDCYTTNIISDKKAFINYVTGLCSRENINGFIIF